MSSEVPVTRVPLPTHESAVERRRVDSVVVVNTGDGKGKSTAAFGVMGRAWARGWRVGRRAVHEERDWKVGEQKLAVHLGVDWWTLGDGFTWESTDLDESAAKNIHAWGVAKEKLASGDYDLLVLDELTYVDQLRLGVRRARSSRGSSAGRRRPTSSSPGVTRRPSWSRSPTR